MFELKDKANMYKIILLVVAGLGLSLFTVTAFDNNNNHEQSIYSSSEVRSGQDLKANTENDNTVNDDCLDGAPFETNLCQKQTTESKGKVSVNETHKLIQDCEVEAFEGSKLHLKGGRVVVSEMPPHDIIETVGYSGSHCPHTIENLTP